MTELEERMFRLSEALRGLEPENASRLRLALKFSREELILEQMRETHKLLKDAQLTKAETEVRELLAKLEHLRNVLLAEDLDFQLKLARLRQMRETLGQLERIIKEERRELGWSRFAVDQRKAKEKLAARQPDLEALVRDQKTVVDDTRALSTEKAGDRADGTGGAARSRGGHRQGRLGPRRRSRVRRLPAVATAQGRDAPGRRHGRASAARTNDLAGAIAAEEKAEAVFREELKRLDARSAAAGARPRRGRIRQARGRPAQDPPGLRVARGRLGPAGRRRGRPPEGPDPRRRRRCRRPRRAWPGPPPSPPRPTSPQALDILTRSAEDLAKAAEKLLVQLRTELQTRLITELTEMHEAQA